MTKGFVRRLLGFPTATDMVTIGHEMKTTCGSFLASSDQYKRTTRWHAGSGGGGLGKGGKIQS